MIDGFINLSVDSARRWSSLFNVMSRKRAVVVVVGERTTVLAVSTAEWPVVKFDCVADERG